MKHLISLNPYSLVSFYMGVFFHRLCRNHNMEKKYIYTIPMGCGKSHLYSASLHITVICAVTQWTLSIMRMSFLQISGSCGNNTPTVM